MVVAAYVIQKSGFWRVCLVYCSEVYSKKTLIYDFNISLFAKRSRMSFGPKHVACCQHNIFFQVILSLCLKHSVAEAGEGGFMRQKRNIYFAKLLMHGSTCSVHHTTANRQM